MQSRFKLFWSLLWAKIRGAGKWLLGAIVAIAILIVALVGLNSDKNKKDETPSKPQVAQVYEPSIGTPLPADTTPSDNSANSSTGGTNGAVAGATTTESSTQALLVAPKSGINPTDPVKYENSSFGIKITLPAGSLVTENNNSIAFFSKSGSLLYSMAIVSTEDNLDTIKEQLKNSSDISTLSSTSFAGNPALQFSTKNQTGYAIIKNNKAFYIIGNAKYLNNINI